VGNLHGDAPVQWPNPQLVAEMKKYPPEDALAFQCDVTNHGREDLLEVRIPILVRYGRSSAASNLTPDLPWQSTVIRINPLDSGTTRTLYIVNACPVEAQFHMPESGSARPVGEDRSREFRVELEHPNTHVQLLASHYNKMQIDCEE
jgi:hypothetical protein